MFEPLDKDFFDLLSKAKAVIFPPTVTSDLYFLVKNSGVPVFPEYTLRFQYPGKIGQIFMCKNLRLPHPESVVLPRLCGLEENPYRKGIKLSFPVVVKGNWGDEGTEVFLLKTKEDFYNFLPTLKTWERSGRYGVVFQEYIPEEFDARSVVIGDTILVFFRAGGFKKNLVQEGTIIPPPQRGLKRRVVELTKRIIAKTRFNLVAIDFLFKDKKPLVNEFNFTFGRRALGEKRYETLLKKAIKKFLEEVL
ncbi:RimK family alpha-L-glutamate ligase [Thermodesulfobacterium sp.]|uniref:ATP-grasp domain-containing protein n=1 Tax=Thermodesulfobacterium sp. TaxID=1965289 RepID=UPI0026475636|nr:hypothetical protein [Thermodesulfobacterium sp.]